MIRSSATSRAFTLLETILALTILFVLMGLIAVLWAQARDWTADAQREDGALHITRLVTTIRTQWGDRRSLDPEKPLQDSAGVSPDAVRFVTASPILFPQWPLVRAEYRIELDTFRGTLSEPRYRLRYTETRLPGGTDDPLGSLDAAGQPMIQSVVLIDDCTLLHWERFGNRRESGATAPERGNRADPEALSGTVAGSEKPSWHRFETDFKDPIPAVRLVGQHGKERFTCVLVVAPLR